MRTVPPIPVVALVAMFLLISAPAPAQVSSSERAALIEFYNATGGDSWEINVRWLGAAGTECEWYGINCVGSAGNRSIRGIRLNDNSLVGEIPEALGELTQLGTLYLADNQLGGNLAPNLWGLSNLEALDLSGNQLAGTIPGALFHQPIVWVNLSGNQFTEYGAINSGLIQITSERRLDLADNGLFSLPPSGWRQSGLITDLDLSGNRLQGTLDLGNDPWPELSVLRVSDVGLTSTLELNAQNLPDLVDLDLSRNELEQWPIDDPAPAGLERINLGHNQIAELPQSLVDLPALAFLDLNDNLLSGPLPAWFDQLQLTRLNLNNNELIGPIDQVLTALDFENFPQETPFGALGLRLHVANNPFDGALPADLDYASFNSPAGGQSPEFGLDLCFTGIELPDADTLQAINNRHRGRALESCLGRERVAIDRTVSGSWYNPNRAGEGITQMLLDNGQLLSYWFTYPTESAAEDLGEQMWLFETTSPGSTWSEHQPLWITWDGRFGQGFEDGRSGAGPSMTWIRQDRVADNQMHFFYQLDDGGICITGGCSYNIETGRYDKTQLSQLAGTTCANQSPQQWISGAWFDPNRAGEGFMVEVIEDGRGVVYWFTYQPDGSGQQAWMTGDAEFNGTTLHIDNLLQPVGASFGPNFNAADVDLVPWGSLTLEFDNDLAGQVSWNSVFEDYGSGSYPIVRLARPLLADCD